MERELGKIITEAARSGDFTKFYDAVNYDDADGKKIAAEILDLLKREKVTIRAAKSILDSVKFDLDNTIL